MVADNARRQAALERLPIPYSTALRLRDAGVSDQLIAKRVGVEPEAVGPMLKVAEAKLAAAEERDAPGQR